MIVEYDFFNAEYLRAVVGIIAKNLFVFTKGLYAVKFLESHPADIVLMDIRLPDISGYEATKLILEKKPHIKIIAQTAYAEMLEYH